MSVTEIRARVAQVIDEHQIAFNKGSIDGVVEGATAELFRTVDVRDPETNEALGTVLVRKVRFTINHVQERLCVGRVSDKAPDEGLSFLQGKTDRLVRLQRVEQRVANEASDRGTARVAIGETARILVAEEEAEPPF